VIGQDLLGKAQRAVEAANRALAASDSETAADRAYYAVYYAAWAMLESAGATRAKTHSGLIAEFSRVFVKTGKVEAAQGADGCSGTFPILWRGCACGHRRDASAGSTPPPQCG
jgi:hypothetical protein